MTAIKVSELNVAHTPYDGTEYSLGIQDNYSVKIPVPNLAGAAGATLVGITPSGTISASTVAGALNELDTEKASTAALAASTGATLVKTIQTGTGAVARTVDAKLKETVSVKDFGAVGDGVTDDYPAFLAAINYIVASNGGRLEIPKATYNLSLNIIPPATIDVELTIESGVIFNGTGSVLVNLLIPWQPTPITSNNLISQEKPVSAAHLYQNASYIKAVGGVGASVAVFGEGDAAGSQAWGGNFVGVASTNVAGSAALAVEINPVNVAGTTAQTFGVVIASAGYHPSANAIQIQSNNNNSTFIDGIKFNFSNYNAISKNIIYALGTGAETAETFINSSGISYSVAEISLPSFAVQGTRANTVNRISVVGAATGTAPTIEPLGSDANITLSIKTKGTGVTAFTQNGAEQFRVRSDYTGTNCNLYVVSGTGAGIIGAMGSGTDSDVMTQGKGTGGFRAVDGGGVIKIQTNTTGVGFNAATPITKPTISGSRGANAAVAALLTALANYGLITDSTTV